MNNLGHVPTNDPLIDMMDHFQEMAERNLLKDGSLCPILFISNDEGVKIIGIPEFGDPKMKKSVLASIQMGIVDKKIKEFIILIEAWTGKSKEAIEHYRRNSTLVNYEKKEEALLLLYSSPQREIIRTAKIVRGDGEPSLLDWKEMSDRQPEMTAIFGGKFNSLWPKSTVSTN